jgi:hypothetical protein
MRMAFDISPKIGNSLSRQTLDGDARYYQRLGGAGVFATRVRAFRSMGNYPDFLYMGGNSEMRGYDYLSFVGQNVLFANAELRFPIIEAALTPIGVVGGVRGVFFANIGGAWFDNQNYRFATNNGQVAVPIVAYKFDALGNAVPVYGPAQVVTDSGCRTPRVMQARARNLALGFPITSTGRGGRCSAKTGNRWLSPACRSTPTARATTARLISAERSSRSGSATTSERFSGIRVSIRDGVFR